MIIKPDAKKLLELSTIELFSKNPVDAVTVKDIVKNCHLSTRTFYNYFNDKYQIINSCYFSIMENYFDENKDNLNFHL